MLAANLTNYQVFQSCVTGQHIAVMEFPTTAEWNLPVSNYLADSEAAPPQPSVCSSGMSRSPQSHLPPSESIHCGNSHSLIFLLLSKTGAGSPSIDEKLASSISDESDGA